MPKWDAKTDTNQGEIVDAARQLGTPYHLTHRLGQGFPDMLVAIPDCRRNVLVEVKTKDGKLTGKEPEFHCTWPGELHIIRSAQEYAVMVARYKGADQAVRYALRMVRQHLLNHRYGGTAGLLGLVDEALEALR